MEAEDKEIKPFKVGCASMRIAYQRSHLDVAGRLPRAGAGACGREGGVCGRVHFVGAETRGAGDVEAVGGVGRGDGGGGGMRVYPRCSGGGPCGRVGW